LEDSIVVVAMNDTFLVKGWSGSSTLLGNVLTNDIYTVPVTITDFLNETEGILDFFNDGSVEYTPPEEGFVGIETFEYTICDEDSEDICDTATVTINVQGVEGVISVLAVNDTFTVKAGSGNTFLGNVLTNDISTVPITITYFNETDVEGILEVNEDGSVEYTPPGDFVGNETFVYTICDADEEEICDTASVTISVTRNTPTVPPTAIGDAYTVIEGETLDVGEVNSILSNDITINSNELFVCENTDV
jgi:large repetitive protein